MNINQYKTVELPGFNVVGAVSKLYTANDKDIEDIAELWTNFNENNVFDTIPYKDTNEVISVYFDYDMNSFDSYSFAIGAIVSDANKIPSGMEIIEIPDLSYAVFSAEGDDISSIVSDMWEKIWDSDLDRSYAYDFEIYDNSSKKSDKMQNGKKKVEIYVSVN